MASLVADYGTSSNEENSELDEDSSSESETNVKDDDTSSKNSSKQTEKLPTPKFGNNTTNSIFSNPFKEEENAKQAILEKHVKMVNTRENTKVLNGKKICWNYRKGRCRFGTKCSFAHDSDLQKTDEEIQEEGKVQQNILFENQCTTEKPAIIINEEISRKKRPGLTQGLVPGKKVMKMYINQNVASTVTHK